MRDRIGLGWRGEIAAGILDRLAEIEVLEVIAEDWARAPRADIDALRALAQACPVHLHGVAMGLASSIPVETARLERIARLVDRVRPQAWSEHLAFVRAGGAEIGHLAAPPRTGETIEGTLRNVASAAKVVGTLPRLENIATLVDPPCSTHDECAWTSSIIAQSGATMLIDLHNLYANALNFGRDPVAMLRAMPLDRVSAVHLSGGAWIERFGVRRLLDDHLHDPPDEVYALLEELAAAAPPALDVIVERDGSYPSMDEMLAQLRRAREAVERGRRRASLREAA